MARPAARLCPSVPSWRTPRQPTTPAPEPRPAPPRPRRARAAPATAPCRIPARELVLPVPAFTEGSARLLIRALLIRVKGYSSGVSQRTPSGGTVIEAEAGRPCQGSGLASMPPRLPTPLPPYTIGSVLITSRQRPAAGRPTL